MGESLPHFKFIVTFLVTMISSRSTTRICRLKGLQVQNKTFIFDGINNKKSSFCPHAAIVSNISLGECYYTLNYKDHWDQGLFTCLHITLKSLNGVVYLHRLLGARHYISGSAIGCSALYIWTSCWVLDIHKYFITILLLPLYFFTVL